MEEQMDKASGIGEMDVPETNVAETGVGEMGVAETGAAEMDVAKTSVAKMGVAETGVAETGIALQVTKLMKQIEKLEEKQQDMAQNQIVVFVGPTKSGKSTLICCLMECKLTYVADSNTQITSIFKSPNESGPTIGIYGQSQTEEPKYFTVIPGTEIIMCDFPGLGDNKGTSSEIINACSYQKILSSQKSVRFVLVVPFDMLLCGNPLPFYQLLSELRTICPQIGNSLCIISTKDHKPRVRGLLSKVNKCVFSEADKHNAEIIAEGKKIIEQVLANNACLDFNAPEIEEGRDEGDFKLPNKQEIIECIKNLSETTVSDFPLVISANAKLQIAELHTVLYQMLKEEVENVCVAIEQYVSPKINDVPEHDAESQLAYFKTAQRDLNDILKKSVDFEKFFEAISEKGMALADTFSAIKKMANKFVFIEKLRNMYKEKITDETSKGMDEFFCSIKITLEKGVVNYSDLIIVSETVTEEELARQQSLMKMHVHEINNLEQQLCVLKQGNSSVVKTGRKFFSLLAQVIKNFIKSLPDQNLTNCHPGF